MAGENLNEYATAEHALAYLAGADRIPHRTEGESVVLELLPPGVRRILDVGAGDGRLLALARLARPQATGVALDSSETMLAAARQRFANAPAVSVVAHDLLRPLPDIGSFDVVVSSFAIHHLEDARKVTLYRELFDVLEPGGLFCYLEHVTSATPRLHAAFYTAMGRTLADEDPSNRCTSVEAQLAWLRQIGFVDADCFWKWRELALLAAVKPL